MSSKEDIVLIYEYDNCKYSVTVTDTDYSLEYVKNILIDKGLESDFDFKFFSFSDDMPMRNFSEEFFVEFFDTYYNSHLDLEVFIAGMMLDIDVSSIEDAYFGQYDSDAEFAEEITSQIYNLKDIPDYLVIDWDASSRDLMYDYNEYYGHYFSNNY